MISVQANITRITNQTSPATINITNGHGPSYEACRELMQAPHNECEDVMREGYMLQHSEHIQKCEINSKESYVDELSPSSNEGVILGWLKRLTISLFKLHQLQNMCLSMII